MKYPSSHLLIDEQSPERVYLTEGKDQPARVFIGVEPTTYSSPEQWLRTKNEERRRVKEDRGDIYTDDVLEKRIRISGYDAIVTYPRSATESFPDEKLTLFIKDGNIFRIGTAYTNHERIWNSFWFD